MMNSLMIKRARKNHRAWIMPLGNVKMGLGKIKKYL